MVTKEHLKKALAELGLQPYDSVIIHSSLKSFGEVDGGADTIIDAFIEFLSEGTVLFPALRTNDFKNAYKDWDINTTPSDVGLISETFRLREGVVRSDQATHSVCAYGRDALFYTSDHGGGTLRKGPFGETAFTTHSPWQKMYEKGAKIIMLGVPLKYSTMKHFAESKLMNNILDGLSGDELKEAVDSLANFDDHVSAIAGTGWRGKAWPWYDGIKYQEFLDSKGLIKHAQCGECSILCVDAIPFVDNLYNELRYRPENWVNQTCAEWREKYRHALKDQLNI